MTSKPTDTPTMLDTADLESIASGDHRRTSPEIGAVFKQHADSRKLKKGGGRKA